MVDCAARSMSTEEDDIGYTDKVKAFAALSERLLSANRAALFGALGASGIAKLVVRFDGQGGYGQIDAIEAHAADGSAMRVPVVDVGMQEAVFDGLAIAVEPRSLRGSVEIVSYTLLEQLHRTWSAGAGAHGDLTFIVASRSIMLRYNKRVLTSIRITQWF